MSELFPPDVVSTALLAELLLAGFSTPAGFRLEAAEVCRLVNGEKKSIQFSKCVQSAAVEMTVLRPAKETVGVITQTLPTC